MSDAGMVRAHQDASLRYFEPGIYRTSHLSGIDVAGVRYYAADGLNRLLLRWKIGFHVSAQIIGVARIEAPGNRGRTNRRGHEAPLTWNLSRCRRERPRSCRPAERGR